MKGSVIYHKSEYRERRNHYAFFAVNREIAGFDTDRETLGMYNGFDPQTVLSNQAGNSIASGWAPIGSHHIQLSLQPGRTVAYLSPWLCGKSQG